jgi:SAM-dependent methyltransferase
MNNPWLNISSSDYENHMTEIGQEQTLSRLTKYYLEKYQPATFALPGCSTGNGLEHVDPEITHEVFAVDINPEYLKITRERFQDKIRNLNTFHLDIDREALPFGHVDLMIAGLILEYVEAKPALKKMVASLNQNGVLVLIIQKNKNTTAVSKTRYTSLETLSKVFREIDEAEIDETLRTLNLELLKREEIALTENKSFVSLEYWPIAK